jgi:hypothetical protein
MGEHDKVQGHRVEAYADAGVRVIETALRAGERYIAAEFAVLTRELEDYAFALQVHPVTHFEPHKDTLGRPGYTAQEEG